MIGAALVVAFVHGVNDAYASFVSPLIPRLMTELGLTVSAGATLAISFSLSASLVQPVAGWWADRHGRKAFLVLGPLVCGVFVSAIAFASSYWALLSLLLIAGLGSAAFHPAGASMAARVEDGRGSGVRLSVFSFGGSIGFAAGPLIAVALVARGGVSGLWVAAFPAILAAALCFLLVPGTPPVPRLAEPPGDGANLRAAGSREVAGAKGILLLLFGISAIGAFLQRIFTTFHPMIVADAGSSEAVGALSLSLYLAGTGFGTLAGGWLTDRVHRGRLLALLSALAFPAHLLALGLRPGSPGALTAAVIAGFLNLAILPPIVVTAQEVWPGRAGRSSGIVMGLAWGAGSLGVLVFGVGGDLLGPRSIALLATPLALLGTLFAVRRPLRDLGEGGDGLVDPSQGLT